MGNGSGAALEFLANPPQLCDEPTGFADGKVGLRDFCHSLAQIVGNIAAAVLAEEALHVGVVFQIGVEIHIVVNHSADLQNTK